VQLRWTLQDLVEEVALQLAALPAPRNGQVRAVPDDRTVRYYGTIGLLDKPVEMRGRTALYGKKHIAQVVAIKRLQALGRSLAEIQQLWPTLDDATLARMSGVAFTGVDPMAPRAFWKSNELAAVRVIPAPAAPAGDASAAAAPAGDATRAPAPGAASPVPALPALPALHVVPGAQPTVGVVVPAAGSAAPSGTIEVRLELAPNVTLALLGIDERAVSLADVRALREAAAPLLAELASRRLASPPGEQS
jgi:DNA-binding transcriptional MerR regulator